MSADAYLARGLTSMPAKGPLSVTVPGAVDGWFSLHQRFGRLEMRRLARDAINYAERGFRLTAFACAAIAANAKLLAESGDGAGVFVPDGHLPVVGDRLVQPNLAQTLTRLASAGPNVLYRGDLGQRIVEFVQARGGTLTGTDLAAHRSEWVEPLAVEYRGARVHELPPNTQGISLLQMLNMLEPADLGAWGRGSAELVHQLVERKKLAFADRDAYVADPARVSVPVDRLLDRTYAAGLAARVDRQASRAAPSSADLRSMAGDTVYLCTADRDGTVVSLIQSLYAAFGSGVHVPGTGVTLHNRGFGFVLTPGHPNALAPGKRPMHTLMPGFVTRGGQPWLAFGTRGADGQPQTGLQIVSGLLDWHQDLQTTIEAPRWAHGAPGGRYPSHALVVESRFGQAVADDLAGRGHQVMVAEAVDPAMGTVQLIEVDQLRGCYIAASDPRGDGVALAL